MKLPWEIDPIIQKFLMQQPTRVLKPLKEESPRIQLPHGKETYFLFIYLLRSIAFSLEEHSFQI